MRVGALLCLLSASVISLSSAASAADCPGHPDAIGTSRTLVVDPVEHARIGTMQYHETLPLEDHEVVLTFDDGPLPPYSKRILEILNSQCVKATYFIIGRMARAYPEMVREEYAAGHTIGTHSQNHPYTFPRMTLAKAQAEVDAGIDSVAAALGDPNQIAPFFRIPGLSRGAVIEQYLESKSIMTWSADFPADDWRHISAGEVLRRALSRLEAHGKGVLLLHDIQPATVMALPSLLRELKKRGYRIVHVVPASATLAKTPTVAAQWLMKPPRETPADVPPAPSTIDAQAPTPPAAAAAPAIAAPVTAAPGPPAAPVAQPAPQNAAVAPAAQPAPAQPTPSQAAASQVVQPQTVPAQAVPTQALPSPTSPSQAAPPVVAQPQIARSHAARRVATAQGAKPKRQARAQTATPSVARAPRHRGTPNAITDHGQRSFGYGATLPSTAADGHVLELRSTSPAAASAPPTDITGSIGTRARLVPSADVPNAGPR